MQVATKLYVIEQQKKQIEKVQKVHIARYRWIHNFKIKTLFEIIIDSNAEFCVQIIEEEEIRSLRKEMIPRAQLMPFFDRPFFPQR